MNIRNTYKTKTKYNFKGKIKKKKFQTFTYYICPSNLNTSWFVPSLIILVFFTLTAETCKARTQFHLRDNSKPVS